MDKPFEDSLEIIKQKSDVQYSQNCENPEQSNKKKSRSNSRSIGQCPSSQNSHFSNVSDKSTNFIRGLAHEDVAQQISKWPFIKQFYQRNTAQFQVKLIETFMKVPSAKDTSGFIYGFMDERQNSVIEIPYWIKIGRTNNQCPQNRIFQWEKDDNKLFTQIFTVRSLYNHKLESLVHSLFAYARKDRHINGKRRIEWFRFGEPTMTAAAVNILNHIMNTIHEKYWNLNHQSSYLSSNVSEYKGLESSERENKALRNMDSKLLETNKYLDELIKLEDPKKLDYFLNPIRTDLSIQIRDKEKKKKLKEINSLEDGLRILEGSSSLGNQIFGVTQKIKMIRSSIVKIQSVFEKMEEGLMAQLRDLSKNTEIKFKAPTTEIKQSENPNEQLVEISKQQFYSSEVEKPQQNLPLDQKIKHFRKKMGKNDRNPVEDEDESKIGKYMKKKNITTNHKQAKGKGKVDNDQNKVQPQQQETTPSNQQTMEIEQIEQNNHESKKQQQEQENQEQKSRQEQKPSQGQKQEHNSEEKQGVLNKYKKDKAKETQNTDDQCSMM